MSDIEAVSDIYDDKAELRRQISEDISALPDDYLADSDIALYRQIISLPEFSSARNIMLYYSVKREPDTHAIAEFALRAGKTVAFPLCYRGGIMKPLIVGDLGELRPAMLNIPAPPDTAVQISPEDLDLIIVPALAYDINGYRLGYGGGYYDRFLLSSPAYTVGLSRERLMKRNLPVEPHDIAVKCVVTEERIIVLQ